MRPTGWRLMAPLLALTVAACATGGTDGSPESKAITGTTSFRPTAALPADALLEVKLADITRTDIAPLIATARIEAGGQTRPTSFELRYSLPKIRRDRLYAVRATLWSGDKLLYATEAPSRVITAGNPMRVELHLREMAEANADGLPATLRGSWFVEDLAGTGSAGRVSATLEFAESGRVSGTGGCNRFSGTVSTAGEAIAFRRFESTRLACVREVAEFETRYLQALGKTEYFLIDGNTLLIYLRDSDKPIRLIRMRRQP